MLIMLTLNLPPALEEDLIDYLLSLDCVGGFTSYRAMGHGEDANLTVAEQVSGRRHRMQFELIVDAEAVETITSGLASEVGKDITYWQYVIAGLGRT